jgi:hypothetical protein
MGHLQDPKCPRIGSTWGGMVLCKQRCCGLQQWSCGVIMNRNKHLLESLLMLDWLGHRGCVKHVGFAS